MTGVYCPKEVCLSAPRPRGIVRRGDSGTHPRSTQHLNNCALSRSILEHIFQITLGQADVVACVVHGGQTNRCLWQTLSLCGNLLLLSCGIRTDPKVQSNPGGRTKFCKGDSREAAGRSPQPQQQPRRCNITENQHLQYLEAQRRYARVFVRRSHQPCKANRGPPQAREIQSCRGYDEEIRQQHILSNGYDGAYHCCATTLTHLYSRLEMTYHANYHHDPSR